MQLGSQRFLPLLVIYLQSSIITADPRRVNDILENIFANNSFASNKRKPSILREDHHGIHNSIHRDTEEKTNDVFTTTLEEFAGRYGEAVYNGHNITNCDWTIHESTSKVRLHCTSVIITQVASEIPDNITSLYFQSCLESRNLSEPVLLHLTLLQELIISESKVNYISRAFLSGLSNLRALRLSYNLLITLEPVIFDHVPNIRLLDLRGNAFLKVSDVTAAASNLPNLIHVELDDNRAIRSILSDDLSSLQNTSIEILSFSGCSISVIVAKALEPLVHLKSLIFSSTFINRNSLINITRDLDKTRIQHLQLRNLSSVFSGSSFITEELKPLANTNLTFLDLDSNLIVRLRDLAFPKLKSLRKLKLNHCFLEYISSKAFHQLTNLKELYLTHNKLGSVTFELPGLHIIDLSSNIRGKEDANGTKGFTMADRGFELFGKLRRFIMQKSDYKGPVTQYTFKGLRNLDHLELSNTFLTSISNYAFLDLHNLKYLLLSFNYLQSLTSHMFVGLGKVTRLYLSHNIIEYISSSDVFQPLVSLEFISLRDNIISVLPDNLFSFNIMLETVLLSKNFVSSWNYDITLRNNSLLVLLLDYNNIEDVTAPMLEMFQRLRVLDMSSNPFKCNTCGMKRFRDWMLETENTTIQKLNDSSEFYICFNTAGEKMSILNTTMSEKLCWSEPARIALIVCVVVVTVVILLTVFCVYKLRLKLGSVIYGVRNRLHSCPEYKIMMNNDNVVMERVP